MGLITSCCCSENEEQNSRVWSVSDTPQPRLGEIGVRPTSRNSDASIRLSQHSRNRVPQNERSSYLNNLRLGDSSERAGDSAPTQNGFIPLHVALYSHYKLDTYNTNLEVSELQEGTIEYERIKRLFMNTTQAHYKVIRIEHINNMFLRLFYLLKKEEYRLLYGRENVTEEILFHGSSLDRIVSICLNNFNWRFHSRQGLFGKGVNFSNISNYASNYCDKSGIRFMIAANVLVCRTCTGTNNMTLPPFYNERAMIRYDTSQKENGHVKVKFYDDEFYPEYLICFSGESVKKVNKP